jgi:hypothetical protein
LVRSLEGAPLFIFAGENPIFFHQNGVVDWRTPRHLAVDFHRARRQVLTQAYKRTKGDILAAVIKMKRDGELQFIPILLYCVTFLSDGLLELMQPEGAFFRCFISTRVGVRENRKSRRERSRKGSGE